MKKLHYVSIGSVSNLLIYLTDIYDAGFIAFYDFSYDGIDD